MSVPLFSPWERFLILSHAADEVPESKGGELLRAVIYAANAAQKAREGKTDHTEAYYRIERARELLEEARRDHGTDDEHRDNGKPRDDDDPDGGLRARYE